MTDSFAPRVLRVITRLNVGGPARHVLLLSRTLAERGYEIDLVAGVESEGEGRLSTDGVHVEVMQDLSRPLTPIKDQRAVRSLTRRMKENKYDIVHTHLAKAGAVGRFSAHRAGVPIVVHTFHGHVLEGYFSRAATGTFTSVERRLARWSDALVAVSDHIRDELLDLGIGRPDQWRVIPVGLDLDHIIHSSYTGEEARALLGLPIAAHLVGAVGRLVPIKELDVFLQAAARIMARDPDAHFVVAGDGELRATLETRATKLLGDRVTFLGWVSDLPALYAALDVVVLTSRNEGTPTSLIEASAASKPVVATRVGGVPEVVADGVTGVLVEPGDIEAIAAAVENLLIDKARAETLGRAGRERVRDRFSAQRVTDNVDRLYRELLDRRPGPKDVVRRKST